MASTAFDELQQELDNGGIEATLDRLAGKLRQEERYHELYDALLMKARYSLGLPVIHPGGYDHLNADLRTKLEDSYRDICREVGQALLDQGSIREAWMYLRFINEDDSIAEALAAVEPNEENLDEIVEIALREGVNPKRGFELILAHYGTCNAITMYEQEMHSKPVEDQRKVAGLLAEHLHGELMDNLKADISRQEGSEPEESTILDLVADRDWLFANDNYHIDTSHLNAVVRFAIVLEDEAAIRKAIDLTEYGRRLASQYQFAGEEPFADTYPHYALYLKALVGDEVDAALAHFRDRAENGPEEAGTAPAEVYIALLARLGRYGEAIDATAELIPAGSRTFGFAPSLNELAEKGGDYQRLMQVSKQRDDLLGFTAGMVQAKLSNGCGK